MAAAGICVMAVVTIAAWPRDSVAAKLRRMRGALLNVKSMQTVLSMQKIGTDKMRLFGRTYTRGTLYAANYFIGQSLESRVVIRDGQFLQEYVRLDHATLQPATDTTPAEISSPGSTALEYVEQAVDMGRAGVPRKLAIREHSDVNGIHTYMVTLDRATDKYHAEIIVDKQTDLPIFAETAVQGGQGLLHYRNDYTFNLPLSDSLFKLTSEKPVIDVLEAQTQLTQAWQKPLVTMSDIAIRDASVMADGSIWIAFTKAAPKPATDRGQAPDPIFGKPEVLPTSLKTESGTTYSRMADLEPSAMVGDVGQYSFGNDDVYLEVYVPLNPNASVPSTATLSFGKRLLRSIGTSSNEPESEEAVGTPVKLALRAEKRDRPSYFSALELDYFGFQLPYTVWDTRAVAYEKAGEFAAAGQCFEQEAYHWGVFLAGHGRSAMKSAARCYQQAGMKVEADKALAKSQKLLRP